MSCGLDDEDINDLHHCRKLCWRALPQAIYHFGMEHIQEQITLTSMSVSTGVALTAVAKPMWASPSSHGRMREQSQAANPELSHLEDLWFLLEAQGLWNVSPDICSEQKHATAMWGPVPPERSMRVGESLWDVTFSRKDSDAGGSWGSQSKRPNFRGKLICKYPFKSEK